MPGSRCSLKYFPDSQGSSTLPRYAAVSKEEELKNKVARDYFSAYDWTKIIGHIDFAIYSRASVRSLSEGIPFLWAEAKQGTADLYRAITQLILTIGRERLHLLHLPPAYVGAFDAEKMAFIPWSEVQEFFHQNDFNWQVRPSDPHTREFARVYEKVKSTLTSRALTFTFGRDDQHLREFIWQNFSENAISPARIQIDRNNFIQIYHRWLQEVKPSIAIDWEKARTRGILDGDFFLADLLSQEDWTLTEKLSVVLRKTHYELERRVDITGLLESKRAEFRDGQVAHRAFWQKYARPPKEEYWDYLIQRRDLLVPQDIRERRGSFFTPQIWVALSQQYLTQALGENWQEEYYIWDCAAGTGNLLHGLVNKYHIWASTLEKQDVDVMHERIRNGANLLEAHTFQFDFLNDEWLPVSRGGKIPDNLFAILSSPEKQARLIIYINPPYAEATTARTVTGTGRNKPGVATQHKVHQHLLPKIGNAANELFALFMAQVYEKLPHSTLALFSTMKFVQGSNFKKFRAYFRARYLGGFVVPAYTFDNVQGDFPIAFTIWKLGEKEEIQEVVCDVYDEKGTRIGKKVFYGNLGETLNRWIVKYRPKSSEGGIGLLSNYPPDFQHQKGVYICINPMKRKGPIRITASNLVPVCVYFAVRHCIRATWLNDRDQFLYPRESWERDLEFQADCVIFTLFHGQNKISREDGPNHWIPFSEEEVGARAKYESDFMVRFLRGQVESSGLAGLWPQGEPKFRVMEHLSPEGSAVYAAARALWRYYHEQADAHPEAALYDIKAYFQGRDEEGRMRNTSADATYNALYERLREALTALAQKIADKAYEHGFLRR